ncbi:uncharacterized protein (DUF58 family) [Silvimonas terrae]|uniref:Uncharacterized protein (DUF58 family) n=1 Tax=Silvimonas terrae TaxID=300266 RepID=A0A840RIH7_9NEIS|nr:DUF58 domain-containing protein [Silvimonas terrae]MBB5192907.1 uncharacterized protein (DUF58 family) [Silvimonas terrae]
MMIPGKRLVLLVALLAALSLPLPWLIADDLAFALSGAALLGVLLASLVDLARLRRISAPRLERQTAGTWPHGRWQQVVLRFSAAQTGLKLSVFDHYPADCQLRGLPQALTLQPGHWQELVYEVNPGRRGDHDFGQADVRVEGPQGLWQRRFWCGEPQQVRVYPDYARVAGYALLAADQGLQRSGVIQKRQRGEGTDFHQLREYRAGDAMRAVDWKATARSGRVISRDYQEERDQQLVLLLDCGRRMNAQDEGLAHFDHALNAAIVLAWAAQRQGDAVGLLTFAGPTRWLPPKRQGTDLSVLLNTIYDLQPTLQPSDYLAAAEQLMHRVPRRALVVLITNLRDEDSETLLPAIQLLRTRHQVMCASLREHVLDDLHTRPVETLDDALVYAAGQEYLGLRKVHFSRLRANRVDALDVTPRQLPLHLVNHYLALKRSGKL